MLIARMRQSIDLCLQTHLRSFGVSQPDVLSPVKRAVSARMTALEGAFDALKFVMVMETSRFSKRNVRQYNVDT